MHRLETISSHCGQLESKSQPWLSAAGPWNSSRHQFKFDMKHHYSDLISFYTFLPLPWAVGVQRLVSHRVFCTKDMSTNRCKHILLGTKEFLYRPLKDDSFSRRNLKPSSRAKNTLEIPIEYHSHFLKYCISLCVLNLWCFCATITESTDIN